MIQDAPDLPGIGTVIFDEFHERALTADLGLALAWEARTALRPDLRILVMSATLDAGPVAALMDDAPLITSEGRAYPVETIWVERAPEPRGWTSAMADLILRALEEAPGGCLAFLPGAPEIARVSSLLSGRLPADVALHPLHGGLPFATQRAAVRPEPKGTRKLVLATAIAETSLTIEDIRIVVDGGRARRARFDAGRGMGGLVTEPVSQAEAAQRRGRAGRVAPGVCYRLWTRAQDGARAAFAPPEIEVADLAGLALELACWGGAEGLRFLTPPPETALAEARGLLGGLGALDAGGRVTDHGREMARLPLHPRLAHMVLRGGHGAARLAALLSERDPLRGRGADLALRLRALDDPVGLGADKGTVARIRQEAKRLRRFEAGEDLGPAAQAALAYPDRVGLRRKGAAPRYLLSGGTGAALPEDDTLGASRLIVATDVEGGGREGRIRTAITLSEAELRAVHGAEIAWHDTCHWDPRTRAIRARRQDRFGALALDDRRWDDPPDAALAEARAQGLRDLGLGALNWTRAARLLRARIGYAQVRDVSDAGLMAALEDWAIPFMSGIRDAAGFGRFDPESALRAWLGWDAMAEVDRLAPAHWETPLGRRLAIDYGGEVPEISVRLQEVLGETRHPVIGPERIPVRLVLLSPAQRPIQVTTDLPGFWAGSYAEVRKDMRAQYPRHPWPENPAEADPTLRSKRRG
jgi:ATP-dependent helicase HrpB